MQTTINRRTLFGGTAAACLVAAAPAAAIAAVAKPAALTDLLPEDEVNLVLAYRGLSAGRKAAAIKLLAAFAGD